jgi:hypothetical protein
MEGKESKKAKRPEPKRKMKKSYQPEDDDDAEKLNDSNPVIEQQEQQKEIYQETEDIFKPPDSPQAQYVQKKVAPMKQRKTKFDSEPTDVYKVKQPVSMPARMRQQQSKLNVDIFENESNDFAARLVPLAPITSIQNLNDILSSKLQSPSIKAFKVNIFPQINFKDKNLLFFPIGLFS